MHCSDCNQMLLQFMRDYLSGTTQMDPTEFSAEELQQIFALAKAHDVAHIIGVVAERAGWTDMEAFRPFFREELTALYRHQKQSNEYAKICALLEQLQVSYIPLKGAVIRTLYAESWHRTSCDIDILIPKSALKTTVQALRNQLNYVNKGMESSNVSLWSPGGVHFELHFDIDEVYIHCDDLWKNSHCEENGFCYRLSNEMLLVSHIAHMAKHFLHGGCGLRPFLDMYLMLEKLPYDEKLYRKMLEQHDLLTFGTMVQRTMDVWLSGQTPDKNTRMISEYILPAGVYGNLKNRVALTKTQTVASGYIRTRMFPPVSYLSTAYPVLKKHPWLLPICWLHRAVRLLFHGKLPALRQERKLSDTITRTDGGQTEQMLKMLGLDDR